ncbi:sulfotransferase family protein, partial [Microcoleus anatoxicus]
MLSQSQSNALIIASMHRSGSSLTAAILQSAGVYIGRELLSPNVGNIKGHYENLDFYHFHMAILESQGINSAGWTLQEKIDVEDRFVEKAKALIKKNSLSQIWGWKEPRTTLFLDFWAELLPEAKFILIYRYPWEVIDSLYRRGDHIFQSQPDMAIKIWLHYNQKILNCYHRFPDRCHLASMNNIIGATDKYIESINQKLQTNLIDSSANIYEPPLLQQLSLDSYRPSVVAHYFPEAIQMYQELEARAWQPQGDPSFSWLEKINANPYKIWAFQDWANIRKLEIENKALQLQIDQLHSQVDAIQGGKALSESQLHATQVELEQSPSQLHATQVELEQSQSQLQQTEDLLPQSQSLLHQTEDVSAEYQTKISEIESFLELYQSQLHQTEEVLEECHTQLKQEQTKVSQLEKYQQTLDHFVDDLRNQLYQVEDVLIEYKTEFEEVEVVALNYQVQYLESQTKLQECQANLHDHQYKYLESQAELQKLKDLFETK